AVKPPVPTRARCSRRGLRTEHRPSETGDRYDRGTGEDVRLVRRSDRVGQLREVLAGSGSQVPLSLKHRLAFAIRPSRREAAELIKYLMKWVQRCDDCKRGSHCG